MPEAKFSVAIARDIAQYVTAQGGDMDGLCRAAGIDRAWLADPDRQIAGDCLKALWREAVAQTHDPDLGLHLGEAFDLAAIGIVGYVLLNCQTYGQALEKLARYTHLFSQGVAISHRVTNGWVQCDCAVLGDVQNYLLDEPRHPIESTFSALLTATQQLTGQPLKLYGVWFQHPQPGNVAEHDRIFQTPVQFAQPINRLAFPASCLDWPVKSANASLLAVFEQHATALLSAQNQGYAQKVGQTISQNLQGDVPSLEAIAHALAISPRQLQRELKNENTSYQRLVDDTRRELALRHLQDPEVSIHDMAFLLGFSEPSAFHRAFKRWTGQTPRHYRLGQSFD
ncbi:AraC family transcriptional regulator [Nodosilinea nodulosa]|uniref:AraC family transcriptional regulator n=1 Tax=Nodosilinea nodulosa TaxID=416001 RepID=UPI00030E1FF3|nr:AraC family transcriptional regulator [Nodosilinea nodulosa]